MLGGGGLKRPRRRLGCSVIGEKKNTTDKSTVPLLITQII
jgi:hypothetical protein